MTARALLLTREPAPGGALLAAAERFRLEPLVIAAVQFSPGRDAALLADRLAHGTWDWIAMTSARAAESLAQAVAGGAAIPARTRLAVVGGATAAPLRSVGIEPALVAPAPSAAALAEAILGLGRARSVLFLHGSRARRELPDAMAAAGVAVELLEVYAAEDAAFDARPLAAALDAGCLAASIVSAPSAAAAICDRLAPREKRLWLDVPAVAAGRTTAEALRSFGAARIVTARDPSEQGLVEALAAVPFGAPQSATMAATPDRSREPSAAPLDPPVRSGMR